MFAIKKKISNTSENFKTHLMPTKIFYSRGTPRLVTFNTFNVCNLLAFKIYYELFSTSVEAVLRCFFLNL